MPKKTVEDLIENTLFASRWLLAPMYLGLASSLILLLIFFMRENFHLLSGAFYLSETEVVLGILSLIDISLTANLVIIVIFSGYENFVSKMDINDETTDSPDWKKRVDFNKLKLKLVTSMVAISGIYLLRVFMDIKTYTNDEVIWSIVIHLVFLLSGVSLAFMDYLSGGKKANTSSIN